MDKGEGSLGQGACDGLGVGRGEAWLAPTKDNHLDRNAGFRLKAGMTVGMAGIALDDLPVTAIFALP